MMYVFSGFRFPVCFHLSSPFFQDDDGHLESQANPEERLQGDIHVHQAQHSGMLSTKNASFVDLSICSYHCLGHIYICNLYFVIVSCFQELR